MVASNILKPIEIEMLVVLPMFGTEIAPYMPTEPDCTEEMDLITEELYALELNLMEIQKQHKNSTNKP